MDTLVDTVGLGMDTVGLGIDTLGLEAGLVTGLDAGLVAGLVAVLDAGLDAAGLGLVAGLHAELRTKLLEDFHEKRCCFEAVPSRRRGDSLGWPCAAPLLLALLLLLLLALLLLLLLALLLLLLALLLGRLWDVTARLRQRNHWSRGVAFMTSKCDLLITSFHRVKDSYLLCRLREEVGELQNWYLLLLRHVPCGRVSRGRQTSPLEDSLDVELGKALHTCRTWCPCYEDEKLEP
mmetsp:Transcript_6143/g.24774  ORF Transcript_6143/g.24774 Transcript_6143/m.24774 type:complete len:235 (-) Transcript_6143:434-1138(-)